MRADTRSALFFLCVLHLLFHDCDFRFHRFYQLCQLFLALLPRGGVDIFGNSFPVNSWGESALVQVVVDHRHATSAGLAYLALIRLKFRFYRLIGCITVACLVRCVRLGNGRVSPCNLAVNPCRRLLLHRVGDMAIDIERGFRADMTYHGGQRFDVHAVFQCHGGKGMAKVVKPHPLAVCAFQYLLKPMIDRRRVSRLREVKRGRENPLAVGSRFQFCQQFCHFGRQQNHAVGGFRFRCGDQHLSVDLQHLP